MSVSHISDNAYRRLFVLALLLLTASGCGEKWAEVFPVSGTLKFNGQAPVGALLVLHAVNPPTDTGEAIVSPTARVKEDGSFVVSSYDTGDGAIPGEYTVTVEWYKPDKDGGPGMNVIPTEYSNPKTSPLKVTINAGGPTTLDPINIKGGTEAAASRGAPARR